MPAPPFLPARLRARTLVRAALLATLAVCGPAAPRRALGQCPPESLAAFPRTPADSVVQRSGIAIDGTRMAIGSPGDPFPVPAAGSVTVYDFDGTQWNPTVTLPCPEPGAGRSFGYEVALDGDWLMASTASTGTGQSGFVLPAVYAFHFDGAAWNFAQKIRPTQMGAASFGSCVALHGTLALMGDFHEELGATPDVGVVYAFELQAGTWTQVQTLAPAGGPDGGGFGYSVDFGGDLAVIGAPLHDDAASQAGGVFFYRRVAGLWIPVDSWVEPGAPKWYRLGTAVAISGTRALAFAEDLDSTIHHAAPENGDLVAFEFDGTQWDRTQVIAGPPGSRDRFGAEVVLRGDHAVTTSTGFADGFGLWLHQLDRGPAGWTIRRSDLVGAKQRANTLDVGLAVGAGGAALLSHHDDASLLLRLAPWTLAEVPGQLAGASGSATMGSTVAVDGQRIVAGAPAEMQAGLRPGAAFVYERSSGTWASAARLLASDGQHQDKFGSSVGVSGDWLVVGAPGRDSIATGMGAAYVFEWTGTAWAERQELLPPDGAANDQFGAAVAIAGDRLVVGAPTHDLPAGNAGGAYLYQRSGATWSLAKILSPLALQAGDNFGTSVAISGDRVVVGAPRDDGAWTDRGLAYLFEYDGSDWPVVTELVPDSNSYIETAGSAVAIDGEVIVVGAHSMDGVVASSGGAHVYERVNGTWSEVKRLYVRDAAVSDWLGWSVAVRGDRILLGALNSDPGVTDAGAAYLWLRDWDGWRQAQKIWASDATYLDGFGSGVGLGADFAAIGARFQDAPNNNSGSVYVFEPDCVAPSATLDVPVAGPLRAGSATLAVHPNPARAGGVCFVDAVPGGAESFELFDPAGRRVRTWTAAPVAAGAPRALALPALAPGTYVLRARSATGVRAGKLVLVR